MKLFVILICLLSERFLIHTVSYSRFYWFSSYFDRVNQQLSQKSARFILVAVILPLVVLCGLILFVFSHLLFGLFALLINVIIFYYCLGPENPFYPVRLKTEAEQSEIEVSSYFAKVNGQLFAVVFWYILTGALGVLIYRLISLCQDQEKTAKIATWLTNALDWVPARMTVFLYLLVGNFQRGIYFLTQKFLSSPENNTLILSKGGLLAAYTSEDSPVQMSSAENLVEHALIVYLVFLALFTLIAWL